MPLSIMDPNWSLSPLKTLGTIVLSCSRGCKLGSHDAERRPFLDVVIPGKYLIRNQKLHGENFQYFSIKKLI